mgnify:CR=1 FL=1
MVVISYGYLVIRWNSETIISDQMRCTINHYTWYIMNYVSNTYGWKNSLVQAQSLEAGHGAQELGHFFVVFGQTTTISGHFFDQFCTIFDSFFNEIWHESNSFVWFKQFSLSLVATKNQNRISEIGKNFIKAKDFLQKLYVCRAWLFYRNAFRHALLFPDEYHLAVARSPNPIDVLNVYRLYVQLQCIVVSRVMWQEACKQRCMWVSLFSLHVPWI